MHSIRTFTVVILIMITTLSTDTPKKMKIRINSTDTPVTVIKPKRIYTLRTMTLHSINTTTHCQTELPLETQLTHASLKMALAKNLAQCQLEPGSESSPA